MHHEFGYDGFTEKKGAKSPKLYIFGASIEVNRRDEQTYCLALLQTYNFNLETSQA